MVKVAFVLDSSNSMISQYVPVLPSTQQTVNPAKRQLVLLHGDQIVDVVRVLTMDVQGLRLTQWKDVEPGPARRTEAWANRSHRCRERFRGV